MDDDIYKYMYNLLRALGFYSMRNPFHPQIKKSLPALKTKAFCLPASALHFKTLTQKT